jgi:hypothetical protein
MQKLWTRLQLAGSKARHCKVRKERALRTLLPSCLSNHIRRVSILERRGANCDFSSIKSAAVGGRPCFSAHLEMVHRRSNSSIFFSGFNQAGFTIILPTEVRLHVTCYSGHELRLCWIPRHVQVYYFCSKVIFNTVSEKQPCARKKGR